MLTAGIDRTGGAIRLLELPDPRPPRAGEVLLDVRACGVGNWDEIVRTGGWDTGVQPPMALGVEAAGLVAAVGESVPGIRVGDAVTTHSVPLREQGGWAEKFIAAAEHIAPVPAGVSFDAAAALPVPALTADQAVTAVEARAGQTILVHGAGGVTGGLLVQLAAHHGARVIATAGAASAGRVRAMGAAHVLDYHQADWPERVRALTDGGADAAVNAARSGARDAVRAVRDGGRLAAITDDLPGPERAITMTAILVVPDGARLRRLIPLLEQDTISMAIGAWYPLEAAAEAMARVQQGTHGEAVVLRPGTRQKA
jgi:NADPH:quinone reductase-like Zn-dependent oxidoreductase